MEEKKKTSVKICRFGAACYRYDCDFSHPSTREKCPQASKCPDIGCKMLHPTDRPKLCQFGTTCRRSGCRFLHPSRSNENPKNNLQSSSQNVKGKDQIKPNTKRGTICPNGERCSLYECKLTHNEGRRRLCENGIKCSNVECLAIHPLNRKGFGLFSSISFSSKYIIVTLPFSSRYLFPSQIQKS
jgi:hypothetical protein